LDPLSLFMKIYDYMFCCASDLNPFSNIGRIASALTS
jgi:hypothetical protein